MGYGNEQQCEGEVKGVLMCTEWLKNFFTFTEYISSVLKRIFPKKHIFVDI